MRSLPGNWPAPPFVRFRALTKASKRGYGYEFISIRELTETSPTRSASTASKPELPSESQHSGATIKMRPWANREVLNVR